MTERKPWLTVTIHDCEVQTFRAGGKGGQNQNKRDTGVRVRHEPSGAVGESREHRTQLQNKKAAFRRMVDDPKFMAWVRMQGGRQAKIESDVEHLMQDRFVRTETRIDGRWTETSLDDLTQ